MFICLCVYVIECIEEYIDPRGLANPALLQSGSVSHTEAVVALST